MKNNQQSNISMTMYEQTIKEAQIELMALQRAIGAQLTEYEQKFGVEFAYTAFVDHAPEGNAELRLIAKL